MKSFVVLSAAGLLLAACAPPGRGLLLGPSPQRPTVTTVDLTEAQFGRVPLVTIAAGTAAADYLSALNGAVQAAEARKADVAFDVVSVVPQKGTPLDQITEAKALTPAATEVGEAVQGDGVPPSRVSLGAMIVPGIEGEEIRVYVR
jgi:hypothetical protein